MKSLLLLVMLGWSAVCVAEAEEPSLEMLLFLADFVDEAGNWDGPDMEEQNYDQDFVKGEGHE